MDMKRYALFQGDEDGNCVTFLDSEQLQELLKDPDGYCGIETFVDEFDEYPEYWSPKVGMLVEIKVLTPRAKTKEWTL